jgi:probable F420-dependent oxidoreductase
MFPGDELKYSVGELDDWVGAVEESGFDHVLFGDHVLGVSPAHASPGWDTRWPGSAAGTPAYTNRDVFREPMVTFGYLAGRCTLELVTAVLVLPQRQTALFAKQAAEVDLLTGGRLRLGVGIGWSPLEYGALGSDFDRRAAVIEEQVVLLRRYWTEETVSFDGAHLHAHAVGIQELPVQRPIPIWFGGSTVRAFERAGRLGDGFILAGNVRPGGELAASVSVATAAAEKAGRDQKPFGVEGRIFPVHLSAREVSEAVASWRRAKVTHLCVDTRYGGLISMSQHIEAVRRAGGLRDG